jgi:hypothetical protein
MTSPFVPWLPMYAPGAVPERPWWRQEGDDYRRADGARVKSVLDGFRFIEWEPTLRLIEAHDTEHPMPVPPPMVGQVWAWPESGTERAVASTWGGRAWFQAEVGQPKPADVGVVCASSEAWGASEWPPRGAVLVAGPTPWGRDVPWAPPGWKP